MCRAMKTLQQPCMWCVSWLGVSETHADCSCIGEYKGIIIPTHYPPCSKLHIISKYQNDFNIYSVSIFPQRLQAKRIEEHRSSILDELTPNQLVQEKAAVQRALLYLESLFGRPNTREERDVARNLYDRYRIIKRLVNRSAAMSGASGSGASDLPTILEHEALALVVSALAPQQLSDTEQNSLVTDSPSDTSTSLMSSADSTDNSTSINENVHTLSLDELNRCLDVARDEKKQLRRTIKEFEEIFEERNGRKMLKSDRSMIEQTYAMYKQKKAKLRLLDALVRKHLAVAKH